MKIMKILVTNDDGIFSPGLQALATALRSLGDVWVVAPEREQNAVGHGMTLHKPLRLHRLKARTYTVNGTPTDCVTLGITQVLRGPPALLVSGINKGVNLGDDVTYSGTVAGAMEGAILGVPSMAVSQDGDTSFKFSVAATFARRIARLILRDGLPDDTFVNVNVPDRSLRAIAGVQVTSLSRRRFKNPIVEKVDPRGRKYYWIAGTRISWDRKKDSDYEALRNGMVSITPLHLDLTHETAMEWLRRWEPVVGGRKPFRSQAGKAVRRWNDEWVRPPGNAL